MEQLTLDMTLDDAKEMKKELDEKDAKEYISKTSKIISISFDSLAIFVSATVCIRQ